MDVYHPQLSIRNTHKFLLVVGICLCGDIHLSIQNWCSREEGGEGRREEEREREKTKKELSKAIVGEEDRGITKPLGWQAKLFFPFQIL